MGLHTNNAEIDRLARELADVTGESVDDAVRAALVERLGRLKRPLMGKDLVDALERVADDFSALPVLDSRSADDLIGYDDGGLPR